MWYTKLFNVLQVIWQALSTLNAFQQLLKINLPQVEHFDATQQIHMTWKQTQI